MKFKIIQLIKKLFSGFSLKRRYKFVEIFANLFSVKIRIFENKYDEFGEDFFIKNNLQKLLSIKKSYIFFDVGANIGNYSLMLKKSFNNSTLYAFEPNSFTYKKLVESTKHLTNYTPTNCGLGSSIKKQLLYTASENKMTGHASLFKEVFSDINPTQTETLEASISTIDTFCEENKISNIDFLKIDVEGSELDVLKGAENLISKNGIRIIQFEFNTMNIISRTFMRDFYLLLNNYSFYRISSNGLVPLGPYTTEHEVFIIQNIVAVNNNLTA